MRDSGRMTAHQRYVLRAVEQLPKRTGTEIAGLPWIGESIDLSGYKLVCEVRKRLSDLHAMGLVERQPGAGRESVWVATQPRGTA